MPTKNEIKRIKSLKQKKKRQQQHVFVAEGEKLVHHFINLGLTAELLFATEEAQVNGAERVTLETMKQMTMLRNPSNALGVFEQPEFSTRLFQEDLVLVLDGIRDPGNLGTILRLCDWFGVGQVICTPDCVDVFNEKVVQASMGSVASVASFYLNRETIVQEAGKRDFQLVATAMQAPSIYEVGFPAKAALIIGNEGKGISQSLLDASAVLTSIPAATTAKAESLNAAMATAVLLSEYHRTKSKFA
jgi:TrmH family RNA methyltransferase